MAGDSPRLTAAAIIRQVIQGDAKMAHFLWNGSEDKEAVAAALAGHAAAALHAMKVHLGLDPIAALDRVVEHEVSNA